MNWLSSKLQQRIENAQYITMPHNCHRAMSHGQLSNVAHTNTSSKYTIASHDGLSWSHDTQLSHHQGSVAETGVQCLAGPLYRHHHVWPQEESWGIFVTDASISSSPGGAPCRRNLLRSSSAESNNRLLAAAFSIEHD